jgi:pSer/pThr/pTyr-binding forkhead associated (FHA) protein
VSAAGLALGDELFAAIGDVAVVAEPHGHVRLTTPAGRSVLPADGTSVIIGRSGTDNIDALLAVSDPMVSRRHAEVMCVDGCATITDLGSRNGTFVIRGDHARRVTEPFALLAGDRVVTVNDTVLLLVEPGG